MLKNQKASLNKLMDISFRPKEKAILVEYDGPVLDENGDGSSSAHNNDSSSDKLITNEILKFPTTTSVGYHNNSMPRGLNSDSFTP